LRVKYTGRLNPSLKNLETSTMITLATIYKDELYLVGNISFSFSKVSILYVYCRL